MGVIQNKIDIETLKSSGGGGGGGSTHVYSTEPQIVGKWVDGSDIYEQSFVLDNIAVGTHLIDDSTNREYIKIDGTIKFTNNYVYNQMYPMTLGSYETMARQQDDGKLYLFTKGNAVKKAYITVRFFEVN